MVAGSDGDSRRIRLSGTEPAVTIQVTLEETKRRSSARVAPRGA